MARQHYYSRVPFRVSMFNRADGFDTFACSEGVEREFIDKELSVVNETKPTPNESVLIRNGELPPVYCAFTAKDGTYVQSCTTYLPLDYTGERSSYMVHNILFTPQETESLFHDANRAPMNPEMFDHDIEHFKITAPNAKPFVKYPETDYKCVPVEDAKWITESFDPLMVQRTLYCIISASCGSLKNLFILLRDNSNEAAIRFFNTVYSIFPYHLRSQISFVSRVSDISKYPNLNIKCLSAVLLVPPAKGAMLNLKTNQYTGMKDEDAAPWRQIIDLFYSMLKNDAIRQEFLAFAKRAVKAVPALAQPSLKMLNNLVFMFRCSSGLFEERLVLPTDDKVIDFFAVYEKYREAMSSEFRTNAIKCLRRYPDTHTAIPPKLFTKLNKIYPTEIPAVKYYIMQVVLDLIHMDIMRDKLFQFVKANYASQEREEKDEIIKNISRVFYGGFLQTQILAFFRQVFLDESPDAQTEIMEKLLLSIRNKEVKEQIMDFLETNFKGFTPKIRHNVYLAAIEHIQEGDELASRLIDLVDANMPEEPDEERTWFELKLVAAARAEQRKRSHPMIKILSSKQGYCSSLVLKKVFNEELGKKAYNEVISGFCAGSLKDLALSLRQAIPLFPDVDEDTNSRLFEHLKECLEEADRKYDLPSIIEADGIIAECYEKEEEPFAVVFWQDFSEKVIAPALGSAIPDVFRYQNPRLFEDALRVAEKYDSVRASDGFRMMQCYKNLLKAASSADLSALVLSVNGMPDDDLRRRYAGEFMRKNPPAGADSSVNITAGCHSVMNFLRTGGYDFPGAFEKAKVSLDERESGRDGDGKSKKGRAPDNGLSAIDAVLAFGNTVNSLCGEKMKDALYADGSSLAGAFNSYIGTGRNQEKKKLISAIAALKPEKNAFAVKCANIAKDSGPKASFFSGLFKKKA